MKPTYTICLLALFFTARVQGQHYDIGLHGGVSLPDLKGHSAQSEGYTSRLAAFGGIRFARVLTPLFRLQTELNYSPQGGQRKGLQPVPADHLRDLPLPEGAPLYARFKTETKIEYLELPLLFEIRLPKFEPGSVAAELHPIYYFAHVGPYLAGRVRAKTYTSGTSLLYTDAAGTQVLPAPAQDFKNTADVRSDIRRIAVGIVGGMGAGYDFEGQQFFWEVRFTRGLTRLQTHPEVAGKNKTGSLIFSVGYQYRL